MNLPDDFGVRQVIGTTHARIDPVAGTVLETLDDRTYTWDEMFNKTQRKDVRFADSQLTHLYDYDAAYRLTWAMGVVIDPAVPEVPTALTRLTTYDLDGVHNRLSTGGTVLSGPSTPLGGYTMDPAACKDLAMNKIHHHAVRSAQLRRQRQPDPHPRKRRLGQCPGDQLPLRLP